MEVTFRQLNTCIEHKLNDASPFYWKDAKNIPRVGEIVYVRGKNDLPREVVSVIYVGQDEVIISVRHVSNDAYKTNRELVWGKSWSGENNEYR